VPSVLPVPGARTPAPSPRTPTGVLRLADADLDALADRLHDRALQSLVVARYACDAVTRGADPALARDAVQDALVLLRREVWLLRPRGAQGLRVALDDLSSHLASAGLPGLVLDLADDAVTALGPDAVATAYRLVQAALGARRPDQPLVVRLAHVAGFVALDLDVGAHDAATWSLRARACGGELVRGEHRTRILLPTTSSDAPRTDDKDHHT